MREGPRMVNGRTASSRDDASDPGVVARPNANRMLVVDGFASYGNTTPSAWPGQASSAANGKYHHDVSMINVRRSGLGRRMATVTMRP